MICRDHSKIIETFWGEKMPHNSSNMQAAAKFEENEWGKNWKGRWYGAKHSIKVFSIALSIV